MKKRTLLGFVLIVFAMSAGAQVDDSKSREILNEASSKMQSFEDISLRFTYNMDNNVYDVHEEKSGTALMKGEKFRIELGGQVMMSDGKTIWTFLPDAKEVQVAGADENIENNPLHILSRWEENYRSKYIRQESVAGHNIHIIDLVPKEGKSFFKVRLRIDSKSKQLVILTMYDKNSTTYTYIIEEFKTNTGISDSKFVFDPSKHADVEVIDLR
ncbi:MAG: LolA family protein [Bacteroidota bacterium]